ncbi:hypothetical protein MTR67_023918, partial [Solanum verrucosum]
GVTPRIQNRQKYRF